MIFYILSLFSSLNTWDFTNIRVNSDSVDNFHNEAQVVLNPTDSLNLVACWRDFRLGHRQVGIAYSFDGGANWKDYLLQGSPFWQDSDPGLTCDKNGNIYLVILTLISVNDSNSLTVFKSDDGGKTFKLQANAVMSTGSTFEDKELIACDRSNSKYAGNLYIPWARFSQGSSQIYSVSSSDKGLSWTDPVVVGDAPGVQWPVPCVGKDGTYYIGWVHFNPPSIKLDRSTDGGVTWGPDITVVSLNINNPHKVDGYIDAFSFPAMDADITDGAYSGNMYIAYMDKGVNGSTDIFFTKSVDKGLTWSKGIKISGDDLAGNDQFHPWLVVDNTGIIHVIFYDQRNGISGGLLDIYYVYSKDAGDTWSDAIRVSSVSSKPHRIYSEAAALKFPAMPGGIIGEYIGLAAWNGNPFPLWSDFRESGKQRIYFGYLKSEAVNEEAFANLSDLNAYFSSNKINIQFSNPLFGAYTFSLYDVSGRNITTTSQTINNTNEFSWEIPSLSQGMYFVRVQSVNYDQFVKIIKMN